jgi:amino acid adenylation domain-containing protein
LLHRYGLSEEFVLPALLGPGTPGGAGEAAPAAPALLLVRADFSGDPSFAAVARRAQQAREAAPALAEPAVGELRAGQAPSGLLALFAYSEPSAAPAAGAAPADGSPVDGGAPFDLVLSLEETSDGLRGRWEGRADLFESATVGRLADHFQALLESAAADPDRPVGQLSLLTGAERHRAVAEWNDTPAAPPAAVDVVQLFEEQARRRPDAPAVACAGERLTYGELNRRANRVAHHLRALGAGPGVLVGVCLERSPEVVVGILGALKAGAAYVPLDPSYPTERLAFMLEDTSCPVLLTREGLRPLLPAGPRAVCLDADRETLERAPDDDPSPSASGDDLAYVIYTSGSTGRPKGVMVTRRNLAHSTAARIAYYAEPPERFLLVSPFAFDSSVAGLFGTLCRGGTLVLPAEEHAGDPARLAELIDRERVTDVLCVPSLYLYLLDGGPGPLRSLRTVVVAGEAASGALAARHRALLPHAALVNEYGPTEASVWCTAYRCEGPAEREQLPIGRPVANTRVYLLDSARQPVPAGVPGELYVGGAGVARGYFNRPELTVEAFVPDPFGGPGDRLYRTGDLARWLPDGNIEFLGRLDHQVKVRGHRIELGEVEAALAQHPDVQQAVAVAREDKPGDRQLVAYVVPRPRAAPTAGGLRQFLKGRLPAAMVPSAFVTLAALPRTPGGKVDRRALPAPLPAEAGAGEYVLPADKVEEALAGIFGEVLGVRRVGARDDFFDLGGHSLTATQVVSRIRQRLHVELPLSALFAAPTVAALRRALGEARADKTAPAAPAPETRTRAPASSAQQRLWFLDQFLTDREVYNVCELLRLQGPLDAENLRRALGALAARHDALRTTFAEEGGELLQAIAPPGPVELPVTDLAGLPPDRREEEARRQAAEAAREHFDLSRGPLWRVRLLRAGPQEHFLLWTLHHIITDGWSMGVMYRDLAELYRSLAEGTPADLPALPGQYADYALWQRSWLEGDGFRGQLEYWKGRLAGPPATLQLPMSKPRPRVQTFRGAVRPFRLPAGLAGRLEALGRREGATAFMALLAAFQALLHRYSGQDDVVVGTPVANRNRAETEEVAGFFVNSLVMRADCSGDPPFRAFLGRVRDAALAAFARQDVPFERLVEELRPPRDTSRQPLFQVMFAFQNMPMLPPPFAGLEPRRLPVHNGTAKFDLTLTLEQESDGLAGWFEYNTDLFDADTVARMEGHLLTLLEGAADDPDRPLGALPLLTAAERRRILYEWNDTRADFPRGRCIHHLVEAQAARTPDAPAVAFGGRELTYREVNGRANRLAHHLRALGVRPGVLVGVCLTRSPDMVLAVLAVLKAGGAYVPLDPAYPRERLEFMLEDTAAPVLLTQRPLLERLPEGKATVLCLDDLDTALDRQPTDNPAGGAEANSVAYVIYTSGSTGRPKGAVLRHEPVVNLIDWVNKTFAVGPGDRLLFVTSLNFDLSVYDVFGTLAAGGCVRVASGAELRDPERLLRVLCEEPITFWDSAPPQLQQVAPFFAGVRPGDRTDRLRLVFLSGDWIPVPLPDAVRATFRNARVISLGGATEAAIWSNFYPIGAVDPAWPSIPYGKPIQNARYHILDGRLQPVPVGVPAELHIGGPCLADGYLNRPELTAERFIPDPFGGPGDRLYKTGDLARYFPDGNIEFLGRLDHQVKIRGYRIELGEIEAALAQHPAVREAVVMARRDESGDRYLAAYVVARPGQTAEADDLRRFLGGKLPDYMVPPYYVALEAFPLSPNGKVDRKALPAPDRSGAARGSAYEAPRNAAEEALAGIWGEVLGLPRVGIHDNFFDLGGHSLKATQAVSRIRQHFRVELPLPAFFEAPTVAGLGRVLEGAAPADGVAGIAAVAGERTRFPASLHQQRFWLLDQLLERHEAYNVPFTVRLRGPLDADALRRALGALAARHDAPRTTFAEEGGELLQVVAPPGPVELPATDLSDRPAEAREDEARRLAVEEARQRFDLARGPLWRARLVRLGPDDHLLVLVLHHSVIDEWSRDILFRDLHTLYAAAVTGAPADLPALPVRYADFALWQRERLTGEAWKAQLEYWKARLAGPLPVLALPADFPPPAAATFRGALHPFDLPAGLTEAVSALSRAEGVTPFMALLAAFQALLHRYSGQDDVVVGTPVANRNRAETEEVVGVFVNTLVVRTDLSGDVTFRELLGRVRREVLGAFANQDVPFEQLQEAARSGGAGAAPLFQVMFSFLGELPSAPEAAGVAWSAGGLLDNGTSKFDLTLFLQASPDGARGTLEYSTDRFGPATAARIAGHFRVLLEGAAADPDRPLSRLPLLAADERQQLLVAWNDTAADYPRTACVHQLVELQAAKTPQRTAVAFEGDAMTYAELNARSNQLAHFLRARGVGPDVPVGLLARRSAKMVVGLLGILKAGGAYLPLDPDFPPDRLTYYARDSRMPVLLAERPPAGFRPGDGVTVVDLDADWPAVSHETTRMLPRGATPDNLAYVLYTSGSTGKPKGVQVPHRALTNFLHAMRRRPGLAEDDVLLAVTTLSFDIHALELWLPLTVGARVVVASRDTAADGDRLRAALGHSRATVLQATPATWRLLLAAGWDGDRRLRALCGGEALPPELAARLLPRVAALWNMYGPTETTVWSTLHRVESAEGPVPIGRPTANTRVYVLDARLNPLPAGCAGELHIGGDGLARGYLKRPELTAEKFIPDPFGGPGDRLYKTGDLARWLPDGTLECLGRLDHQVKVRGYRVELGEIEATLAQHPDVQQAVVVARKDPSGADTLAAYVIPKPGRAPAADALRGHLRVALPDYMVPAAFVVMDAFPLTPNGKVDRKALPAPDRAADDGRTRAAPRDDAERDLLKVWEDVLKVGAIGTEDNFFDLGGHSLLAAVLVGRVKADLGHALPLGTLFAAPTVAKMAAVIRHSLEGGSGSCLVPLQEGGARPPLFLVAGVGGHVFTYHKFARLLGTGQPVYGVKAVGADGRQAPLDRVEDIAAHYVREINALRPGGPVIPGGYSIGGVIAFETAVQLAGQGREVPFLAVFDMLAPGYPKPLPRYRRMLIHLRNFLRAGGRERREYLAQRLGNVKADVLRWLGLDVLNAPDIEGADLPGKGKQTAVRRALTTARLVARSTALRGEPEDAAAEDPEVVLKRVWAALAAAQRRYRPQKKFAGKLVLFKAEAGFHWAATVFDDPLMGWREYVTGGVETHLIPGEHLDLFKDQNIRLLADKLRDAVGRLT